MATIGAFTALYGSGRPYVYRAAMLAIIAAGFALAVGIGIAASASHVSALLAVTAIGMTATLLCRALNTGPPGAYLFTLACAAGTAMPAAHITAWHAAALVAAGGAFSWLVHMAGALWKPRRPEKVAVIRAARAIAQFVEALATPAQDASRHRAALALHEAWTTLVSCQPLHRRTDDTVARLRGLNRDLHRLYAEALGHAARGEAMPPDAALRAQRMAALARDPREVRPVDPDELPLGRPGAFDSLREALSPGSMSLLVVTRVGIASLIAGLLGAAMALEHVYWSIAAAVLVLHYGFDWRRTVQRGLERLVGTWMGLLVAAAVLAWNPQGLWLVASIALLQFTIEMLVLRNYAWAVVFITAVALLIAAGGHAPRDATDLLLARGVDTTLGCLVGIAVFALLKPGFASRQLVSRMAQVREHLEAVRALLHQRDVASASARRTRRDLQHQLFGLAEAYEGAIGGTARERREAEQAWPAVADLQRDAYAVLSACWRVEHPGA